jgi:hypothetical protein
MPSPKPRPLVDLKSPTKACPGRVVSTRLPVAPVVTTAFPESLPLFVAKALKCSTQAGESMTAQRNIRSGVCYVYCANVLCCALGLGTERVYVRPFPETV